MIQKAILLSVATGAISYFISKASILERPRDWLERHSKFMEYLLTCVYCLSHWIAAPLVIIYRVNLFSMWLPLDYFLTIMMVAWIASVADIIWRAIRRE